MKICFKKQSQQKLRPTEKALLLNGRRQKKVPTDQLCEIGVEELIDDITFDTPLAAVFYSPLLQID